MSAVFCMQLRGDLAPEHQRVTFLPLLANLEDADADGIIRDMCEVLDALGAFEFFVRGFGERQWRVSMDWELCAVLEQVVELFSWLNADDTSRFDLVFYPQGVERTLVMTQRGGIVRMVGQPLMGSIRSPRDWRPRVRVETIRTTELRAQIMALVLRFLELTAVLCPEAARHPRWLRYFAPIVGQ